jgi:hypothetical protein
MEHQNVITDEDAENRFYSRSETIGSLAINGMRV